MKKKVVTRERRSDAERNYQLLLEVARQAFSEKGASVRLDEIARTAGVGIGTLYRHFPTREALVQQVYRDEVEQLAAKASKLLKHHTPAVALRRWLHLFVEHLAKEQLLAETLQINSGDTSSMAQTSGVLIGEAVAMLVQQAIEAKEVVAEIDPSDLLRALAGIATIYPSLQWERNARRLADVMVAGICR